MLTCAASRARRRGLSVGEPRHNCGFHVVMRTCHGICLPPYPTLLLRLSTLCRIFLLNIRLVQIYPFETPSSSILAQPTGATLCPLLEMFGSITAAKRSCTTRVCVFHRKGRTRPGWTVSSVSQKCTPLNRCRRCTLWRHVKDLEEARGAATRL